MDILEPVKLSEHQFFLQWFTDACERAGFVRVRNPIIPWKIRQVAAKIKMCRKILNGSPLLVPCGGFPDSVALPMAWYHEIIPVMWDTWPQYHSRIVSSFRRNKIRLAFFTQRQVAQKIGAILPHVKCVWLPEALNSSGYEMGNELCNRSTDLLELGRLSLEFHRNVVGHIKRHLFKDPSEGLLFRDLNELSEGLSNAKITVSFPRCDTNPQQAGEIETMTQRYWESMLSRTVILGRTPQELIDFMGYNPGIEVDWGDPLGQVQNVIENIGDYQDLVDKNYAFAIRHANWDDRMPLIKNALRDIGIIKEDVE